MIRDQETLNILLDNITRFVRERLVPNEDVVAETDEIPADIVADIKASVGWRTVLVAGLNGGGRGYYALDITDTSNPKQLWEFCADATVCPLSDGDLGLTFGNPQFGTLANGHLATVMQANRPSRVAGHRPDCFGQGPAGQLGQHEGGGQGGVWVVRVRACVCVRGEYVRGWDIRE